LGVHETTAQRTVERIEDALIKSGKFALSSKRKLLEADLNFEVVVANVTEHLIEHPKKATQARSDPARKVHG
jgi:hypothetical protein